jgi:uncharacterized protein CbrC (UPF0167 family)
MEPLPTFKYFPEPVREEMFVRSENPCQCCGKKRGLAYAGYVTSDEGSFEDAFCPWCIASGEVASKFSVEFIDRAAIGGHGDWDPVPDSVADELMKRTPVFIAWQETEWFTHCGDAAVYLGRAGGKELRGKWKDAVSSIRARMDMTDAQWEFYLEQLGPEADCTAYVFKCLHCGQLGGFSDCN